MKKGRPGHVVHALADPTLVASLRHVLRRTTGTFGARALSATRWPAARQMTTVLVEGQPVRMKVGEHRAKPEIEDLVALSTRTGIPVRELQARAEDAWRAQEGSPPPRSTAPPAGGSADIPIGASTPRRPPRCGLGPVAVDVRVSELEAQALVEPVGGLPARPGGEVDRAGARGLGDRQRGLHQSGTHAAASDALVHHDVLDPGAHAGRDEEEHEGEHALDPPVRVLGHEEAGGRGGDDPLELRQRERGR